MDIASYLSNQKTLLSNSMGADDQPTAMTRYMGGHNRTNQAFISGYHQIVVQPPAKLFGSDAPNATKWLTSTCESFTPHSVTINMVDLMGIGQVGSSFPVSKTVNREFTLAFREYRNLPILNIFRTWNSLFDAHAGIATLSASDFVPVNYKGCIMVGILKPTMGNDGSISEDDIEDLYMYEGVFPMTIPEDTISAADQGTNDTIQASITFKFDGAPLDRSYSGLVDQYLNLVNENSYNNIYNNVGVSL